MKVYLSGPMRGYENFNHAAFDSAAAYLRAHGHEVFNPAEKDREYDPIGKTWKNKTGDIKAAEAAGFNRRVAIRNDLNYIMDHAQVIALLNGWEASKGAQAELWLARFLDLHEWHLSEFDVEQGKTKVA